MSGYPQTPLDSRKSYKRPRDEAGMVSGLTSVSAGADEKATNQVFELELTKLTAEDKCSGKEAGRGSDKNIEFQLYPLKAISDLYLAAEEHAQQSADGGDNRMKDGSIKVRFLVTLNKQLYFALEGRPNPVWKVPAHWHMTNAVRVTDARCLATGNVSILFQDGKYSIPFISNKSGDFKPASNTLQWLFASLLSSDLLTKQIKVEKHDSGIREGVVNLESIKGKILKLYSAEEIGQLDRENANLEIMMGNYKTDNPRGAKTETVQKPTSKVRRGLNSAFGPQGVDPAPVVEQKPQEELLARFSFKKASDFVPTASEIERAEMFRFLNSGGGKDDGEKPAATNNVIDEAGIASQQAPVFRKLF